MLLDSMPMIKPNVPDTGINLVQTNLQIA